MNTPARKVAPYLTYMHVFETSGPNIEGYIYNIVTDSNYIMTHEVLKNSSAWYKNETSEENFIGNELKIDTENKLFDYGKGPEEYIRYTLVERREFGKKNKKSKTKNKKNQKIKDKKK